MMRTQRQSGSTEIECQLDATPQAAGRARSVLEASVFDDVAEQVLADAALVLSELVENAAEHGTSETVSAGVRLVSGNCIGVTVANGADQRLPRRPWSMPGPESVRGRGLAVVEALAPRIDVRDGHGLVEVSALLGTPP